MILVYLCRLHLSSYLLTKLLPPYMNLNIIKQVFKMDVWMIKMPGKKRQLLKLLRWTVKFIFTPLPQIATPVDCVFGNKIKSIFCLCVFVGRREAICAGDRGVFWCPVLCFPQQVLRTGKEGNNCGDQLYVCRLQKLSRLSNSLMSKLTTSFLCPRTQSLSGINFIHFPTVSGMTLFWCPFAVQSFVTMFTVHWPTHRIYCENQLLLITVHICLGIHLL